MSVAELPLQHSGHTGCVPHVVGELGIRKVFAEVLPGDKADLVNELRGRGSEWRWWETA